MKQHLQILEEGHDERKKGEGVPSLVEANKRNHITKRWGQGLLSAQNQPSAIVKQTAPDEGPKALLVFNDQHQSTIKKHHTRPKCE
jgi:hypothetical protein